MRPAFFSLRGLVFFVVAIAVGAGVALGGWWVYDTYFPSPAHSFEKAQKAFDKAELVYANDRDAAEPLYQEVTAQLNKMAERAQKDDMPTNVQGFLLRAKTLNRLAAIAYDREKAQGITRDSKAESVIDKTTEIQIYKDMLQTYDKDNIVAAGELLEHYMGLDDLGRAQLYADVVARYQLKEGEKATAHLNTQQAAAHYLLAERLLRGPDPKPELALQHVRAIEDLPRPEKAPKREKRWREHAVEAKALKMRLDMARKRAAEGGAPPQGVLSDDVAAQLRAELTDGTAQAQKALTTEVPGDNDKNPPIPALTRESPTNTRGLLDFLTLAIEAADTKEEAIERANLLLAVCEQLATAKKTRESTIKSVANHLAKLPTAVDQPALERKNPALRLVPADWTPIEARLRKVIEQADAAGAPLDPDAWLELARKARMDRRWKDVEDSAKKGLELARKHNLGTDYASVQNLHGEAAWALFAQNKTPAAEEHLAVLRTTRNLARMAFLIDGLAAVREGRLEIGVKNLKAAQQDPRYVHSLLPVAGLARAYEGLGYHDDALIMLAKLDAAYREPNRLSDEERMIVAEFFPSADAAALETMRCQLALNEIDQAQATKQRLAKRPAELAARLLLVNHYLTAGRRQMAADNPLDARDLFDAADKELKAMPQAMRTEPAVVWAGVMVLASRPRGIQSDGPSNVAKAEQMLKEHIAAHPDFESYLLWVRWLEGRGRSDEINAVLAKLDTDFADRKKTIDALRARLAVVREQSGPIGRLVAALRGPAGDLSADALQLLFLTAGIGNRESGVGNPTPYSRLSTADALLGRQESNLLLNLWNAEKAQAAGQYTDAARAYGRAISPGRYQAEAQTGLLSCLVAVMDKDSPKSAADLVDELRRDNPNDPVLLAAYAESRRRMDAVQDRESMEAALRVLESVLNPPARKAVAADLLARGFYVAGRPDLARVESARALRLDAGYTPALALAARLSAEAGDYEGCQTYAEQLEQSFYGTPDAKRMAPVVPAPRSALDRPLPTPVDGQYWRAVALEHLGRPDQARRLYQDMIAKYPTVSAGYLGMAGVTKDSAAALETVRQWRAKNPTDAAGAAAEVRLLAQAGKTDEAAKVGETYAGNKPAALVTVARAFAAAQAYDPAEAWGRRAVQAAKDKPDVIAAQLAVADACRARGESKQGDARKADIDKALTAYKAVWALSPGNPAAGYPLAALQAKERNESDAAYAVAQDVRKGLHSQRMVSGDRLTLEQLDTLADVYRLSKHTGDAVTLLREAVKQRYPREPKVLLQLGLAYRDQNLPRQAVAVLTDAQIAALERADAAPADQKARWQAVADEARTAREKLNGKK